jgi:cyanophycin synthetase
VDAHTERFRSAIAQDGALNLTSVRVFHGPNPFSGYGSALCELAGNGATISARTLRGRLHSAYPGCCDPASGSAKGKANAAAIAVCVAELSAWLLQKCGDLGALSGSSADGRSAAAWVEHTSIIPGLQALKAAIVAVSAALESEDAAGATPSSLQGLQEACRLRTPNFDTQILIAAAQRRSIPCLRLGSHKSVWQFGWGSRSERYWVTASNSDGMVAQRISRDKELTKRFLRQLGIPTPDSRVVRPDEDIRSAVKAVGWPCAIKPLTGGAGRGVSANVQDMAGAERALAVARQVHPDILVEQHVPGDDHRLMVIDGRLVAAVKRSPPAVVGNGRTSIADLIEALNAQRRKGYQANGFLEPVALDRALAAALASRGFEYRSVPAKGEKVLLRTSSNRSAGGTCEDVTAKVHPQIREMAQHCAAAFGFRATGIDYVTPDIGKSFQEVGGGVLELNTTPGTRVLLAAGMDPDEIGGLFLGSKPGRIPVALLVGPDEALGVIEAEIAGKVAPNDGMATSAEARIGDFLLPHSVQDAQKRATMLLCHPVVERLFILWTPDELQRFGLPLDRFDRAVLLNSALDERWIDVLRQHAEKLQIVKSNQKAIAALLGGQA